MLSNDNANDGPCRVDIAKRRLDERFSNEDLVMDPVGLRVAAALAAASRLILRLIMLPNKKYEDETERRVRELEDDEEAE